MPKRRRLTVQIWYELIQCSYNHGDCNDDSPCEDRIGFYGTKREADGHGKSRGKLMTQEEYEKFLQSLGNGGYYVKPHSVVVTDHVGMKGHIVTTLPEKVQLSV